MKNIGIHGRRIKDEAIDEIRSLYSYMVSKDFRIEISETFYRENSDLFDGLDQLPRYPNAVQSGQFDAVFSIGGDGTLLETVTHVGHSGVPILGVNAGRLGFLATTGKENGEQAIDQLFAGAYKVEERSLIELVSSESLFGDTNFALNEFALLRKDTSSMITVHCYLDGAYLNTYWADGLMVSTPTGSTGYSLSCGGPILLPENRNFVITPVSPHNLNIRPLVIPDTGELTFKIDSRDINVLVSLDSRSETISSSLKLKVKKTDFNLRLIKLEGSSYLETLRNKLGWGFDRRN